jgi:hypothetical protein
MVRHTAYLSTLPVVAFVAWIGLTRLLPLFHLNRIQDDELASRRYAAVGGQYMFNCREGFIRKCVYLESDLVATWRDVAKGQNVTVKIRAVGCPIQGRGSAVHRITIVLAH